MKLQLGLVVVGSGLRGAKCFGQGATMLDGSEYSASQRSGLQGIGNGLIDRAIERRRAQFGREQHSRVLELGAGSGEHLGFVAGDTYEEWVCLDLAPGHTDPLLMRGLVDRGIEFVSGDAESLTYSDCSFDEVISTCLLHHVGNPEAALMEMKRVVKIGGRITIGMPTDPGMMNRLVKQVVTYPQMRRVGIQEPALQYAREHRNHVGAILQHVRHIFSSDSLKITYLPFHLPSWNLNLMSIVSVLRLT